MLGQILENVCFWIWIVAMLLQINRWRSQILTIIVLGLKKNIVMQLWCLQIEFNNIFNACNILFSVCFEYIHKKKNHVADYWSSKKLLENMT
jgi:hypothetical protein